MSATVQVLHIVTDYVRLRKFATPLARCDSTDSGYVDINHRPAQIRPFRAEGSGTSRVALQLPCSMVANVLCNSDVAFCNRTRDAVD